MFFPTTETAEEAGTSSNNNGTRKKQTKIKKPQQEQQGMAPKSPKPASTLGRQSSFERKGLPTNPFFDVVMPDLIDDAVEERENSELQQARAEIADLKTQLEDARSQLATTSAQQSDQGQLEELKAQLEAARQDCEQKAQLLREQQEQQDALRDSAKHGRR